MRKTSPSDPKTTKEIGNLGEKLAAEYLEAQGYSILERNYWKKYGEIDLIATKPVSHGTDSAVHFIEVKTVSYETKRDLEYAVSYETWRPEELVHHFKVNQIRKAAETWLMERNYHGNWQIDVVAMRIVPQETFSTANLIENVTL